MIDLRKLIREANVVVEVVDARDVDGTRLKLAERWTGTSKLLIVANKMDLLEGKGPKLPKHSIKVSAKEGGEEDRKRLARTILGRTKERPAKVLFIGYPNVGKSSLINLLAQRKAAKVAPIAGTTKNVQWIKIGTSLLITDYRGIYPKKEQREDLARKGAINVEENAEAHAHKLAEKVLGSKKLRSWMEQRLDIDLKDAESSDDVLEAIARRRGLLLRGGELNIHEAAKILLRSMKDAPELR